MVGEKRAQNTVTVYYEGAKQADKDKISNNRKVVDNTLAGGADNLNSLPIVY